MLKSTPVVQWINALIFNSLLPKIFTFSFRLEILPLHRKQSPLAKETFFSMPLLKQLVVLQFWVCYQSHLSITQFNWLRTEEKKWHHRNRFAALDPRCYFLGRWNKSQKKCLLPVDLWPGSWHFFVLKAVSKDQKSHEKSGENLLLLSSGKALPHSH